MTEQQKADWFAGRWIAIQPRGRLLWRVRRLITGQVEDSPLWFPSEKKAQKYADKLNAKETA